MSSSIEWTQEVWNPVTGCTRASRGCDGCYAVGMTRRLGAQGHPKYVGLVNPGKSHFNGTVRTHEDELGKPFTWKKPRTVFVNSMSDLFHRDVPFEFIDQVMTVIAMTPKHTYQVLTKRPEIAAQYFEEWRRGERSLPLAAQNETFGWKLPLPNLWLGTSVEDQAAADERIPHLLRVPAAVRFLSCEPLLGPLDLTKYLLSLRLEGLHATRGAHWVIVGGESGTGARTCDIAWIRDVVKQCRVFGVPVFVKQLGAVPMESEEAWRAQSPTPVLSHRNRNRVPDGYVPLLQLDAKGGDMDAWPEDLRVREMPA